MCKIYISEIFRVASLHARPELGPLCACRAFFRVIRVISAARLTSPAPGLTLRPCVSSVPAPPSAGQGPARMTRKAKM